MANSKRKPSNNGGSRKRASTKRKLVNSPADLERDARDFMAYTDRAPDWINNLLVEALEVMSRLTGYPTPTWQPGESKTEQVKMLAELLGAVMYKSFDLTDSKTKVRLALYELLHNPDCPQDLFEAVGQFTCDQSNEGAENIYHSDQVLALVLASVPLEGTRAFVRAQNTN